MISMMETSIATVIAPVKVAVNEKASYDTCAIDIPTKETAERA
eukprot:CAMPEP_0201671330 /NCGR_PEP_ID=MMETSP0494-20130426/29250_1 /ASSEMBLY_ACC=CAM_ASM_000839 /TAXON_ID=420259 /ORGANISM="Thalassiosira gravida, Strain GMp14c1" /LENGTH=42 /DNA_ID= /DNA_START= /DNA_END= /DNA_ORIENTATION=